MKLRARIQRWKRTLQLIWRPTERQLWAAYRLGHIARSNEEKRASKPFVPMLCSTCVYTYTPKEPQDQLDKHTDPKKEAMMDFLQLDDSRELPVVPGQLSALYHQKFPTGKLKKVSITKIEDDPDAWVL